MSAQETLKINDSRKICVFKGSWIALTRPLTLTGTFSPIAVGTIYALYIGHINISLFIGLVIATLLIQSAVNMLNDYFDFRNGQDKDKWRETSTPAPFHQPQFEAVIYIACLLLVLAMGVGVWLVAQTNVWILLTGIGGIICGVYYSFGKHSFSALGLGEVIAAIFLGIVPMNLAFVIQGHALNMNILLVSVLFSFLISTMILTNNIRDLKKDLGFRQTLAIRLGYKKAMILLTGILSSLYILTCLLVLFNITPWQTLITLFAMPFTWFLYQSLGANATRMTYGCMKWAGWHHWFFSMMFIIGLCIAL